MTVKAKNIVSQKMKIVKVGHVQARQENLRNGLFEAAQ
jgi:hypothetical protein